MSLLLQEDASILLCPSASKGAWVGPRPSSTLKFHIFLWNFQQIRLS